MTKMSKRAKTPILTYASVFSRDLAYYRMGTVTDIQSCMIDVTDECNYLRP